MSNYVWACLLTRTSLGNITFLPLHRKLKSISIGIIPRLRHFVSCKLDIISIDHLSNPVSCMELQHGAVLGKSTETNLAPAETGPLDLPYGFW